MDGKKALIGMSGGVDSSVAALLMLRAGYECVGATMRLYDNDMIGLKRDTPAVVWTTWRMPAA